MPMLTTLRMRLPVWPSTRRCARARQNAAMRSSTACTSGTTSSPSTTMRSLARRAQRDVQHRALLGDVDLLAAEHRLDALAQAARLGQLARSSRSVSSVTRFFE